jgi:putative ABC transport system permease protein
VVAASVQKRLLAPGSGIVVNDVGRELRTTLSSLTALDLSGLTRLELLFALLMAVAASGLLLALGFAERRRTFAIAYALGARRAQSAIFVWSETAFVTAGGVALGAFAGWVEAYVVTKILTGVFDPPPEVLTIPWGYVIGVLVVILVSAAVASLLAVRASQRPALEAIRDL